jgi:hypothetical protein
MANIIIKATIKPAEGMSIPVAQAVDIEIDGDGTRLDSALKKIPQYLTEDEYNNLEYIDPETPYFIISEGES